MSQCCILKTQGLYVHKDSIVCPYLYMQENCTPGRHNVSTGSICKAFVSLAQTVIVQLCREFTDHSIYSFYVNISLLVLYTLKYMWCGKVYGGGCRPSNQL